jgi:GNAT superfamily N-acetyltransferase
MKFIRLISGIIADAKVEYIDIMNKMPLARVLVWTGLLLIAAVVPIKFIAKDIKSSDILLAVIQIMGFFTAALMVVVTIVKQQSENNSAASQQIYQRLEIESIQLFRFDIQHADLAEYIWSTDDPGKQLPEGNQSRERIRLQQYIAQILNLFEMAVRFRRDDIMPVDVFGSWVIWINSLCASKNFCLYWRHMEPELQLNYIPELRNMINEGLNIHHGKLQADLGNTTEVGDIVDENCRTFFAMVAKQLGCKQVGKWLNNAIGETEIGESTHIRWADNRDDPAEFAQFFVDNVQKEYISHGEILDGRAASVNAWSDDIHSILTNQFTRACNRESDESYSETRLAVAYNDAGQLVGLGYLGFDKSAGIPLVMLYDLIVRMTSRSKGVGSQLLQWLETQFRSEGIGRIFLESGVGNYRAHGFFESRDFSQVSGTYMKTL